MQTCFNTTENFFFFVINFTFKRTVFGFLFFFLSRSTTVEKESLRLCALILRHLKLIFIHFYTVLSCSDRKIAIRDIKNRTWTLETWQTTAYNRSIHESKSALTSHIIHNIYTHTKCSAGRFHKSAIALDDTLTRFSKHLHVITHVVWVFQWMDGRDVDRAMYISKCVALSTDCTQMSMGFL